MDKNIISRFLRRGENVSPLDINGWYCESEWDINGWQCDFTFRKGIAEFLRIGFEIENQNGEEINTKMK